MFHLRQFPSSAITAPSRYARKGARSPRRCTKPRTASRCTITNTAYSAGNARKTALTELIKGCTSSPAEVAGKANAVPPHKHAYAYKDEKDYKNPKETKGKGDLKDVRPDGWIEKCTFCIHRVRRGEDPYCVVSCPSQARIFGDLENPDSKVSQLIKKYKPMRLKDNKGAWLKDSELEKSTKPNVFYIRSFKPEAKTA
ncbi:MAG: hypothetical protein HY759_02375 [Nitrospirae bacterium]|nr:hypothetical protein [Nitrospirota bacterium]